MFTYTQANKLALREELKYGITAVVTEMYPDTDITQYLTSQIAKASLSRIAMVTPELEGLNTMVPEEEYASQIALYTEDERKIAWRYRTLELRIILLKSITNNTKKVSYLVQNTLEALVRSVLFNGAESITLSQLIHDMKLSSTTYTDRIGNTHPITQWGVDELRLQLVNELCELDFMDMRVSHHTHMIRIPDAKSSIIPSSIWERLALISRFLSRKTILLEPAELDLQMISQSSWWYKTPTLSSDQLEFITTMHNLKWEFIPNALELIEDAYCKHLDVPVLPSWAKARVEEYKEQIRQSQANGGHYIAGKFDSALRWYWQAEIGHTQTSEALRKLVRPVGMNAVKYDMSNNVIQMYAVSLKDKDLAKYVGLVHSDETVADVRLQLANAMNKNLEIDTFNRDNIKPLFMVWAYNAGKSRLLDGVYTEERHFFTGEMVRRLKVEGLRSIVASSGKAIDDETVWNVFEAILHKLVPTVVELKRIMSRVVKGNPFTEASWVLPDGAIAQYASVETHSKELHWVSSDAKMRQHTHYRKELVANAKAAGLLPRMIHSIDAYLMRQLVIRASAQGIVVVPNHDSFMFDEQYTDTMLQIVRTLFIEIMNSNVFYGLMKQFNRSNVSENGTYVDRSLLSTTDLEVSMPWKLED